MGGLVGADQAEELAGGGGPDSSAQSGAKGKRSARRSKVAIRDFTCF